MRSNAAYSSSHPKFSFFTSVWRMTVRVSREGRSSNVRIMRSHPSDIFGRQTLLYTSGFGAATVT